jgi:hypothetical protein
MHARPHIPQLAGSTALLAQKALAPVPQVPSWGAQVVAHVPFMHCVPGAHARPHIPQLASSVWRLAHWPLHSVSDAAHEAAHVPFEQT